MNITRTPIIPITELRRNFGAITENLAHLDEIILTRGGEPFAILKATPEEKKKLLKKAAGSWHKTSLDSDALWRDVFKKTSRKAAIAI